MSTATVLLSVAMVLVMAEEFDWVPRWIRDGSALLVNNRLYRTAFVCSFLVAMAVYASLGMVGLPAPMQTSM